MAILRKRAAVDNKAVNGLYIHSNPPRILSLSAAHIKQLIRNGDIEKLEQVVLEGEGKKLIGEYSADYKTRMFLKSVPSLMSKISLLHDAVNSDRLAEIQTILDEEPERKRKLVMAKDESGVGLLHKAIYYDLKSIHRWLIDKFPQTVNMRDSEGRTPYFYTLMCKDPAAVQKLLTVAGADPYVQDYRQHTIKHYTTHKQELELPCGPKSSIATSRKSTGNKECLNFKKSNIRIWIHQRNMANLQQVVWEGHGQKLLVEHSNNTKIRKFLEAVPYIMGLIKDVHCDVQNGDLDSLKNRIAPPIPIAVLTAKDSNGLTPLHKAVGLGKDEIAKYIISEVPSSVTAVDNEGRTPLHYAALLKDDQKMFNYLIENGADESALDNRQKTAAYYKTRTSELDSKLLHVVPDCPRGAKEPTSFDWSMLTTTAPALSVNGVVKKSVEKIANGVKEKLDTKDSSETTELEGQSEAKDSPKENIKEDDETPEKEDEQTEENNVANTEDDHGKEEEEEHERSIEEPAKESDEAQEAESYKNENTENDENKAIEDANQNDTEQDHQENEIAENRETGATENPDHTSDYTKHEDEEKEEDEANDAEDKSKPEEGDPDNAVERHSDEETDEKEENNNEPDSTHSETAPVSEKAEEYHEGSRTRPSSRHTHTQSASKSRPVRQAGSRSRPSTGKKHTPDNDHDISDKKQEGEEEDKNNEEHEDEVEGEGVIEGVVNGENEVETVNNEGQNRIDTNDHDVRSLIESGNMEQLAALVLKGEGEKLVGAKSDNQELQTFLDNVPLYMSKINRIHIAARAGSLRDLQAALDRRKFAVARDNISANGATPLHVAIAFVRTSIVRYLAGRFPETVNVQDDNGRTPLHYAAVLRDNGHYYNLLIHLGADNRIKDKFGHTPDYYIKSQSEFNHRQLLLDFGAEEEADEFLNEDALDLWSARKNLDDEDMISVLERCYAVLHGRRNSNSVSATSVNSVQSGVNNINYASSHILGKQIKRCVFDKVKLRLTKLDHNLYDIIWPSVKKLPAEASIKHALGEDFPLGIVAPDLYCYHVFEEFLIPIIKEYNYKDVNHDFPSHPPTEFLQNSNEIDVDLDPQGKLIITGTLECARNLKNFELPKSLAHGELEMVERLVTDILLSNHTARALYPNATDYEIKENGSGIYYSMNEVLEEPSEARVILASNNLLIPLWNIPESDRLHGKHWPYGRGVFINNSCNLAVYVNVLDHIRIITSTAHSSPGTVGLIYSRMSRLMAILQSELEFVFDEKLGYLTSRPTVLGCGLHFNLVLRCPNLLKEPDNMKSLCAVRTLSCHGNPNSPEVVRLGNCVTVGVTELQCFEDFTTAVANILQLEKDMAVTNSLHIAAMFLRIFKKKKAASANGQ